MKIKHRILLMKEGMFDIVSNIRSLISINDKSIYLEDFA